MKREFDFLVIGSGVAGLTFALKVADYGKVAIIVKSCIDNTNTSLAQGGVAAVFSETDNYEKHIEDTYIASDKFANKDVIRMVVSEAPDRIKDLINLGASFDRDETGGYDLAREGGHSEKRILHHKDNTGYEIQQVLVKHVCNHPNISVFEKHFAVEILTQHHLGKVVKRTSTDTECYGAYVLNLDTNMVDAFLAKKTLIATGGSGNVYQTTTNPVVATGDGLAMVYRAKGTIENMEFFQFHPTALYNPGERPASLISEAVRGFGGILRDVKGEKFMQKYDYRESLAPRDIVARAIDNEMKISGSDHVYLDCRNLDEKKLKDHFPNIAAKCKTIGIDISKDMIPVIPAAHYQCGGIKVDTNGQTSIKNLYASGEVSSTGLHGANRLASNSLSEALVYSHRAAQHTVKHITDTDFNRNIPEWDFKGTSHPEEMILITQNYREMQAIMSNYVGIVRSNLRLQRAMNRLEIIHKETETLFRKSTLSQQLCELRNLINVGYLIIRNAQDRQESLGLHYNIDYPYKQ